MPLPLPPIDPEVVALLFIVGGTASVIAFYLTIAAVEIGGAIETPLPRLPFPQAA